MSILKNIIQPTGVTATFHTVTGGGYGKTSVTAIVLSWLDEQHTDAQGFAPLASTNVDVTPALGLPAVVPTTGDTFGSVFYKGLDQFLVTQQIPAPLPPPNSDGTPGALLPPINGVFFGGTVV